MKNNILIQLGLLLSVLVVAGCESDPTGEPEPVDFTGDWILVTKIVQKAACSGGEPNDTEIQELIIAQDGPVVTLRFTEYEMTGEVLDGNLHAEGLLPDGQAVSLNLAPGGPALEGSLQITGSACQERRAATATRRPPDADFSGHWKFRLTVVGEGGCEHIVDYDDCFRIFQDGRDLLVVDDESGNLFGQVTGDVAEILRDTVEETTYLIFYLDEPAREMTGNASRTFHELGCRTDLVFVGTPSDVPCANAKH